MDEKFPYEKLLAWHDRNGRHNLPWRRDLDVLTKKDSGYRVWLSEILLQQTQAPRVVGFFEKILERYPSVEDLAKTDFETFFPYYDGLWYYSRARNLLAAARKVVTEFEGVFPERTQALRSLPGIGPYTAEAIRAFAYDIAALPFDTNLEKVFSRYFFGTRFRKLTPEEKADIIEEFTKTGLSARTVSGALMDFANLVAFNAPSKIDWENYPLPHCRFFETRGKLEETPKKAPEYFPMKDSVLVALLFDHSGKTLFSADSSGFSPFFISPTENDPRSAIKEFFGREGLSVSVRPPYSKGFLDGAPLAFFRCRVQTGNTKNMGGYPKEAFQEWGRAYAAGQESDFAKMPWQGKIEDNT